MPRSSHFHHIEPDHHPSASMMLPSHDATPAVAKIFREIVSAAGNGHFRPGDAPLIEVYASALVLARRAHAELEKAPTPRWLAVYEKTTRAAGTLASRLRLAPQQRLNARTAARSKHKPVDAYALMREGMTNGHDNA
jgi:hypothetical protein